MSVRTSTNKNAAYRTNVASHEPIHSKARINWFIFKAWILRIAACMAFWAIVMTGLVSAFM